jgi:hypothetical protein
MSATAVDNTTCITKCSVCEAEFPPLLLASGPGTLVWECRKCGAAYQGKISFRSPRHLRGALRPRQYFPEKVVLPEADDSVREFAERLIAADREMDRRSAPRKPLMLAVPAVPLDADDFPTAEAVMLISRDISSTGISLLHREPLQGRMAILLEIPERPAAQLVVEIMRSLRVGDFYEIAGLFIDRL